jgi:hypothetical protein
MDVASSTDLTYGRGSDGAENEYSDPFSRLAQAILPL